MTVTLPIKNSSDVYTLAPSKIIALGLNYRGHIAESTTLGMRAITNSTPEEPILFPKTPNVLIGTGEAIVLPALAKRYNFSTPRVDYEAELALVISRRGKNIAAAAAYEHILGFTCFNDVSQRNIQSADKSGWFRGKSFDTFGPIGPILVPPKEIGNAQNLEIVCRLNGKVVQAANTAQMIFGISQIVAFVSENFTLEAGDIIATGTPAGVGALLAGDVVEVEIENIGILKNYIIEE